MRIRGAVLLAVLAAAAVRPFGRRRIGVESGRDGLSVGAAGDGTGERADGAAARVDSDHAGGGRHHDPGL